MCIRDSNINGGKDFWKLHKYVDNYNSPMGIPLFGNLRAETSKIEFPEIWSVKTTDVNNSGDEYFPKKIVYLKWTTKTGYLQLKKIYKPELPADYKFPKHLGCNDDLYKDLKEYHPDESRKEKRLRIRSYAKKRREENRIYYTKKISSIVARITSPARKLIKLTLYVIKIPISFIVLTFENILYAIKTNSVHELVFKLLLFPFFVVNHISATQKLPTFTEIKESERYYYLAFRGLVRTVVYIALLAAIPIYFIISA